VKMLPPSSVWSGQNTIAHCCAMAAGQVLTRSSGSALSPSECVVSGSPLGFQEGGAPFDRSSHGQDSPAYCQAPRPSAISVGIGATVQQLWGKGLASVRLGLGKPPVYSGWTEEPPAARNRSPELTAAAPLSLFH
jgi:hypothetical protein